MSANDGDGLTAKIEKPTQNKKVTQRPLKFKAVKAYLCLLIVSA
jgi:hypothetical protein